MRRCSSASCMRTSKPPPASPSPGPGPHRRRPATMTTTVLTVAHLRRPAVDRMYLLSQLTAHANSVRFLHRDGDEDDDCGADGAAARGDERDPHPSLPASVMLYIVWRPGDDDDDDVGDDVGEEDGDGGGATSDSPSPSAAAAAVAAVARSFAEGRVTDCVRRCLRANGDDLVRPDHRDDDEDDDERPPSTSALVGGGVLLRTRSLDVDDEPISPRKDGEQTRHHRRRLEGGRGRRQVTRIYVVVDRISSPSRSEEDDDEDGEEGLEGEEEEEEEELSNELGDFFQDLDTEDDSEDRMKKDGGAGTLFRRSNSSPASSDPRRRQSQHGHRNPEKITRDDGRRRRRRRRLLRSPRERGATIRHDREVRLAEQLARAVSASPALRGSVDGITVGVSSDPSHSAPGLEACAEAVERGARERRLAARWSSLARSPPPPSSSSTSFSSSSSSRGGRDDDDDGGYARRRARASDRLREASPERSPLAIVAVRPEDLECLADHHHHHHHHHGETSDGIGGTRTLKCRVSTEWNGRGEYNSFADRAMGDWRRAWRDGVGGVGGEGAGAGAVGGAPCAAIDGCGGNVIGNNGRPKVPSVTRAGRREAADDDLTEHDVSEPISSVMVSIFLAVVIAHVWSTYGDAFLAYCKRW